MMDDGSTDGRVTGGGEGHAVITAFEPPRLLETKGDVHGVLLWELTPERGGTELVFTSTFDLPDEFQYRTLGGW